MQRRVRQELIIKLIQEKPISTQDELVQALEEQNVYVTQATISRDIRILHLIKVRDENGQFNYHLPETEESDEKKRLARLLKLYFRTLDTQDKMMVIQTAPGSAPAIGKLINEQYSQLIFTVMSNDDRIFIVMRDGHNVLDLAEIIEKLME